MEKATLEHAWRYFELHAGHRMSLFNFFTALASINLAGLGATFLATRTFSAVGILLGLALALLSFVFWKLDQRVSFLVKHSEQVLATFEPIVLSPGGCLFSEEPAKTAHPDNQQGWRGIWTYGRAFRVTFFAMAAIGLSGSLLSTLRCVGLISLEASTASSDAKPKPVPTPRASLSLQRTSLPSPGPSHAATAAAKPVPTSSNMIGAE